MGYYEDETTGAPRWVPARAAPAAAIGAGIPMLAEAALPLTQKPVSGKTDSAAAQPQAGTPAYQDLLAEYLQDTTGLSEWDSRNRADLASRGVYRPELQRLPSGQLIAMPDSGGEGIGQTRTADGRIYKPYMPDDGGETSQGGQMTGYELAEPKAKTLEELGAKLTPEQAEKFKGKRFFRYEKFSPDGKSLGYGYRPEDTRNFLSAVVQDLGPMISMMLPFTGIPALLGGGISSLTGLTGLPAQMASSALLNGGLGAAAGGDFVTSALQGAVGTGAAPLVGGAVSGLGIDNQMINSALTGAGASGVKALLGRGDLKDALLSGALQGGATGAAGQFAPDDPMLAQGIKMIPSLVKNGGKVNPLQLALAFAQANK